MYCASASVSACVCVCVCVCIPFPKLLPWDSAPMHDDRRAFTSCLACCFHPSFCRTWCMRKCQKRPIHMPKETYSFKWQKRPIHMAKSRPHNIRVPVGRSRRGPCACLQCLPTGPAVCISVTRDLFMCQKRPIHVPKETYSYGKKRPIHMAKRGLFTLASDYVLHQVTIHMAKETYLNGKKDLFIWQKEAYSH